MRRVLVSLLALALVVGGAVTALVLRHDSRFTEAGCQKGFVRLSDEYLRELRGGTAEESAGEEAEHEGEHEGEKGICLRADVRKPEPFDDLMKANATMLNRFALTSPQAYADAVRQAAALSSTGIPGTDGTWTQVGNGPVVFDNAAYTNTNGLANGLSKASGRISAYAFDAKDNVLFASVANGGVWKSTNRGQSWTSIGNDLPTQIVGGLGWTPEGGTQGTLIALTGDNAFGGNTYPGLGIYYSTDQGQHWVKATSDLDGAMGFRIAVDPGAPDVVYAATGYGLYRSADAGRTWTNEKLPTSTKCAGVHTGSCFLANVVTDVVVRGKDSFGHADGAVTAVVGWRAGQRKNPDGSVQAPNNGVYTSPDGVKPFTKVPDSAGFAPTANVGRVSLGYAYGPKQNHDYLYALVQDAQLFNKGTVEGLDVPQETEPVLGTCPTCTSTYLNGVYVSKDFGKTWTQLVRREQFLNPASNSTLATLQAIGFGPGIQSWYNSWIQPDPYKQNASGVPTSLTLGLEEIWQNRMDPLGAIPQPLDGSTPVDVTAVAPYASTGGPASGACLLSTTQDVCNAASGIFGNTTHPDQHAAIFLPPVGSSAETLVVGNDGGNYTAPVPASGNLKQSDFGKGAQTGFNTLLPYSVAVAKDGTVYAGLQDNGTIKIAPADVAADGVKAGDQIEVYGGDGTDALVDPDDPNQALYAPAGGSLAVTHDGGKTNASVYPDAKDPQFVTPFAFDDASTSRVIYAARDIWVANHKIADINDSSAFTSVFDLGTHDHPGDAAATATDSDPDNVTTAVGMSNGTAYVGFCGSCDPVLKNLKFHNGIATNASGSWKIVPATGLPQRLVNAVKVDPTNPKVVYVGLGSSTVRQFAPPHALGDDGVDPTGGYVYKSTDGGQTFTDITGDLPKTGVTSLQIVGGQLVAGTTVGVFAAKDTAGGSWGRLGDNLPSAPVTQIAVDPANPQQIYVANFGRGIYRYTFAGDGSSTGGGSTGNGGGSTGSGGTGNGGGTPGCVDRTAPTSHVGSYRASLTARHRIHVTGTARDTGCGHRLAAVKVSVSKTTRNGTCRYLHRDGTWSKAQACGRRHYVFTARGTGSWSFTTPQALGAGHYVVRERAIDRAGNVERAGRRNVATVRIHRR
ncbi:MAG: hypothetical protein ACTHJH_07460 [Marmoricola sp.]